MAVLGTAIALGSWIGHGWKAAIGVELVTLVAACGYFVLGGRDSDLGALFGARADERQASVGMRATALSGNAMAVVAVGGVVVGTAVGSSAWPFVLFCAVGASAFVVGLFVDRSR
jgi:hypothetical protein